MGQGFVLKCKKCNYRYEANLGCGFFFPTEYKETVDAVKAGKYGDEYRSFMAEHPFAAIDCEYALAACTKCNKLDTVRNMSLYLPKTEPEEPAEYVMAYELAEDYELQKTYEHRCASCNGKMRLIKTEIKVEYAEDDYGYELDYEALANAFGLKCPECGSEMEDDPSAEIMWD